MKPRDPTVHVRIPPEIKTQLEKSSRSNRRSLNAEIVHRLSWSLEDGSSGFELETPRRIRKLKEGKENDPPIKAFKITVNSDEAELVYMYRSVSYDSQRVIYSLSAVLSDKIAGIDVEATLATYE